MQTDNKHTKICSKWLVFKGPLKDYFYFWKTFLLGVEIQPQSSASDRTPSLPVRSSADIMPIKTGEIIFLKNNHLEWPYKHITNEKKKKKHLLHKIYYNLIELQRPMLYEPKPTPYSPPSCSTRWKVLSRFIWYGTQGLLWLQVGAIFLGMARQHSLSCSQLSVNWG